MRIYYSHKIDSLYPCHAPPSLHTVCSKLTDCVMCISAPSLCLNSFLCLKCLSAHPLPADVLAIFQDLSPKSVLLRPFLPSLHLYSTFPLSRDHNCSLLSVSRTPKQQWNNQFSILGFYSSVTKSCPTLCDPMDCSMWSFPVLHYLPEFAQTHIHWVSDVMQLSHPLSSPSPPALNLSQH